jgi:Radical SAM superfamily
MNSLEPMHQARTLSIMPTFRCTAACRNCGTLSSPREDTFLPLNLIMRAIEQAAADGRYKVVVFTGGEATLIGEGLFECIQHAHAKGLVTRLVTNGHWAAELDSAADYVRRLVSAGLDEINFSTGDQHARFVPVETVVRGVCVAMATGLRISIMVELVEPRRITKIAVESHPDFMAACQRHPDVYVKVIESPWMPLAPLKTYEYADGMACNSANLSARGGCDSVLTTTTIQADGTINACCGIGLRNISELHLGNIRNTDLADADAEAGDDFLKRWIRIEGPERILAWAAQHDPSIEWENIYAHHCQACKRLYSDPKVRQVILEHHTEKLADVLLAETLRYGFITNA